MFGGSGLFGQQQPATSVGGIGGILGAQQPQFGAQQAQQQGLFGAPQQQAGGLFGSSGQGTQGQQPGLGAIGGIGQGIGGAGVGLGMGMQQQQAPSFGLGAQNTLGIGTQPTGFGGVGFGQQQQQQQQQGSLFGQPQGGGIGGGLGFGQQQQNTGLLGQSQTPQSGIFGGNQNQSGGGLFGQPNQNSLFGQNQQQQQQQQQPGLFGQQQQPQQNTGLGMFGQAQPQQQQQIGLGFGQQQTTTPGFGGAGGGLFQQQQTQQNQYGYNNQMLQQNAQQQGNQIVLPNGVDDSSNDANLEQKVRLEDSISGIVWSTTMPAYFAASSWDGKVRIFEITQASFKREICERRMFQVDGAVGQVQNPIVCLDAKQDLSILFIGCGFDNTIRAIDANTAQIVPLGQHQGLIVGVHWIESLQMVVTISTDTTLKMWDIRSPGQPRFQCQFQHKPLITDCNFPVLIIGFAGEKISIININELQQLTGRFQYIDSPLGLHSQITALSIFPSKDGFGLGSIDGRGHLTNITTKQNQGLPTEFQLKSIMTFKAHKVEDNQKGKIQNYFFPVNSLQPNIKNSSFLMTAGGEGQMIFWDIQVRNKIRTFQFNCNPIVFAKVSPDGSMLAYALGNDFSKGAEYFNEFPPKLCVHFIPDNELRCQR